MVSPRRLLRFASLCRRVMARVEPDLVHGVDPAAQMALTALSRMRLARDYILTVHGTELLRYAAESFPRLWMGRGMSRAAAICAVSEAVCDRLHETFDLDSDRTFVSHPGIAPAWRSPRSAAGNGVRARLGIDADAFVVLTVARVVREKGQDRVITGLARVSPELRGRTVYVIAGTGPDSYGRQLDEAALAAGVRALRIGAADDDELVALCDSADVFAMLSRETPKRLEGLGLTYLEAGARGVPSIACDTGGVTEAVLDGRTGLVLPALASADEVATAFTRLAEDADLRARLGDAAREHAVDFTYDRHAREVYGRAGIL